MAGVLKDAAVHFKDLLDPEANTLVTALALADTSSVGRARYKDEFEGLKQGLHECIKEFVDENYQGFNNSIGSYRTVLQSIERSHGNVNSSKELLLKAKSDLASRRPILKELRASSQSYQKMLDILTTIEDLKSVQEKVEEHIAQKRFLSAQQTLKEALAKADQVELAQIGVMQPIHAYLQTQESSLYSIVMEELLSHLYLKSPYCDGRWSRYAHSQDSIGNIEQLIEDKVKLDASLESSTTASGSAMLDKFLGELDTTDAASIEKQDDTKTGKRTSAESDSFRYIRLLVETLTSMNRLHKANDELKRRTQGELYRLVEKTISEVTARMPKTFGRSLPKDSLAVFLEYDTQDSDVRLSVLRDLMWTLYSKLIAVLQGHRVIHAVVDNISARVGGQKESPILEYDFFYFYDGIQKEIRAILTSYIASKPLTLSGSAMIGSSGDSIRSAASSAAAAKHAGFKFASADFDTKERVDEQARLELSLAETVPGLVGKKPTVDDEDATFTPFAGSQSSMSHKVLVAPNVFNIRVVFEPTVVFLQRVRSLLPYHDRNKTRNPEAFLDTFLVDTFLPQLNETLKSTFNELMYSPEALSVDPRSSKLSKKPIFKSASSFVSLFTISCRLLNTSIAYRERYANLLIATITWLHDYYHAKYNELVEVQLQAAPPVTTPSSPITASKGSRKISCVLATQDVVRRLHSMFLAQNESSPEALEGLNKEIQLYISGQKAAGQPPSSPVDGQSGLRKVDLTDILDLDSFRSLNVLTTSVRWLALTLKKMRKVDEDVSTTETGGTLKSRVKKRWTLLEVSTSARSQAAQGAAGSGLGPQEYLTLAGESVTDFDNAIASLEKLADLCVFTLRSDVRCRTVYYIDKAMAEGNYTPALDLEERDSYIGALETDVVNCDEVMMETLVDPDHTFILWGLSALMNELLVYGAASITNINHNGVLKMRCNILVLRQMMKLIVSNPTQVDFSRATTFYDLFENTPNSLLDSIINKKVKANYNEVKIVLRLLHQEIIRKHEQSGRREAALAQRGYEREHLVALHQFYWGSGN